MNTRYVVAVRREKKMDEAMVFSFNAEEHALAFIFEVKSEYPEFEVMLTHDDTEEINCDSGSKKITYTR